MARLPRNLLPDGFFHVTALGVDGIEIFRDDDDRRFLLVLFARAVDAGAWTTHALCLMTTHYHLVVDTTVERLSAALHRANGVYAQRFNERYSRRGHLFGGRYGARVIESDDYLRTACEYVIDNPVRAGLCATAGDWRWSWSRYGLSSGRGG